MTNAQFKITSQGAPVVNHGTKRNMELALVEVDMRTKYCDVLSIGDDDGVPEIYLQSTDRTPADHNFKGKTQEDATVIAFPEYTGWQVVTADCSRYTLRVVFGMKKDPE